MYLLTRFPILILVLAATACSVLTLQPSDFGWPVEAVLPVDKDGTVSEERYSIEFNTVALFYEEFKDSLSYMNKELRMIRNNDGFYFITSTDFKNVYVFNASNGTLKLENKILISESGINKPAFNQRPPYIELIADGRKFNLTKEGIEGGNK